jgi:hypothetical protein
MLLFCVSDGSGALFLLSIPTVLNPWELIIKKKRERTARPVVFTKGHAQIKFYCPEFVVGGVVTAGVSLVVGGETM